MPLIPATPRDILLEYLQAPPVTVVPGADGLTTEEILDAYPLVVRAGQAPGPDELAKRHPALASELAGFFAARGWFGSRR
jgi:hypothetical protein